MCVCGLEVEWMSKRKSVFPLQGLGRIVQTVHALSDLCHV